jgi:hypothetical protein
MLGTLVKAVARSMIGTWFMVDMAYIYGNTSWCMVDALVDGR